MLLDKETKQLLNVTWNEHALLYYNNEISYYSVMKSDC